MRTTRVALGAAQSTQRDFVMAGFAVSIRFAGPALPPLLTPAFEHLKSPSPRLPELTILAWDSRSTGVQMPPPPWNVDAYSVRGEIEGLGSGRFRAAFQSDFGGLSVIDLERDLAVFWVPDARDLTSSERAAPFLRILHWWMAEKGRQVVHAAAVGNSTGVVILGGAGGSGKSGTALACLNAGLRYSADDYCLLDLGPPATAHSMYNSAKVHSKDLSRLPFLEPLVSNPRRDENEKALFFLHQHLPSQLPAPVALRAILLPTVTGGSSTRLRPATAAEVVRVLSPSTISQLPHAGEPTLRAIASLARQVPAYRLDLGPDVEQIPEVIAGLLS